MSVLYIALPVALLLGASGMIACIRCIKSGQYEDLDSPPMRMLIDNENMRREGEAPAELFPAATHSLQTSNAQNDCL